MENQTHREQFFKEFNEERGKKIRSLWYFQMEREERNIPFFDWFLPKKGRCQVNALENT